MCLLSTAKVTRQETNKLGVMAVQPMVHGAFIRGVSVVKWSCMLHSVGHEGIRAAGNRRQPRKNPKTWPIPAENDHTSKTKKGKNSPKEQMQSESEVVNHISVTYT